MLAHCGPAGGAALLLLVNASWLPPAWKEADIQPIPKPRDPAKLRPISLTSCAAKTAERMVLSRLQWRVWPLHPHELGFTRGSSTADSIITLLMRANHRSTLAVFLDLEKAFELASPHAILTILAGKGVRGRLLAWLRDYLLHRRARVRYQGHRSSFRELENGTPQGGILSPFLFNLLMEELVALPFQEGVALLSYADDLALVVTGRGDHPSRAQRALDLITAKCEELGIKVSSEKSRAMAIRAPTPPGRLRVQGVGLEWTSSYLYLGVWLDSRLSFTAQLQYLRERMQARTNVMRAMTRPGAGATYRVLRLYYVQAVRSLVDYCAPVLAALSPSQQERLEVAQNGALRTMLGAPRWCSACVMQSEAGLVPLADRVSFIATCRVARVLRRDAQGAVLATLRLAMEQGEDCLRGSPWLASVTRPARVLGRVASRRPCRHLPDPCPVGATPRHLHRHSPACEEGRPHHPGAAAACTRRHRGHRDAWRRRLLH